VTAVDWFFEVYICARFEVLTEAKIHIVVFWAVKSFSPVRGTGVSEIYIPTSSEWK
jgi:hypothetical protein